MSTTSICTANYATPCVPCYILASTAVYSPPYNLTTIEVEATPYIYPYQNGSSSTSWKYVTLTQTMPTRLSDGETQPTATSDGIIFSDPTDVTWTTGDLTLTYPTTYINYYAFSGVGVDVTNETACAQFDSISKLAIPSNTDEMSFLMEFTPTGTTTSYAQYGPATSFPQGVLRYLDTFPAVTSQLGGQPVESCLPIKASPECTTSKSSKHCSTKCLTGLPAATMYYTNISTSVRPATTYTITNYNSSTPSYSYTTLPETTFTKTSISTTTLVNTKNNYTTVSCATTCTDRGGPSSSAVPSAPFFTFTLTTASILTTIKKNPIFATVPEGIVDDEPARAPEKPTVTTNATTITNAPPRPASPTAIPVGKTTKKNVGDSGVGLITCVGANCGQTAASRPTKGASLGSGDEPQENDNKPPGNTNKPPGNTNKPSENANRPPGNANKPNPIDSDDDEQHSPSRIPTIVAIITAASQTLTITKSNNGALVLGTKTLPSGRTITLPNTQLLRNDDASSAIYLDTSKIHFSTLLTQEGSPQLSGVIFTGVRGNIEIATKIHPGVFVIEGITLIAGQAVTLSHGGGILSVGSNNIIQLDGAVLGITALGAAAIYYNIGKQTLTPGGIITQDTETITSLDDSGRIYYIDGSSIPISDGVVNVGGTKYTPVVMATTITTTTTTGEVGGYVMQAIASAASVRLSATATVRESGRETGSETRSEVASASPTSSSSVRGVSGLRGWMVGLVIAGIFAVVY